MKVVNFNVRVDGMVFIPEPTAIPLNCPFDVDKLTRRACGLIGASDGIMVTTSAKTIILSVDYAPFTGEDRQFLLSLFSTAFSKLHLNPKDLGLVFDFTEPGALIITRLVR